MNIRGGLTPSLFAKNVWELGGGNPSKWGMYECQMLEMISLSVIGGGGWDPGLISLIKRGPLQYGFFQNFSVKHNLRLFLT